MSYEKKMEYLNNLLQSIRDRKNKVVASMMQEDEDFADWLESMFDNMEYEVERVQLHEEEMHDLDERLFN